MMKKELVVFILVLFTLISAACSQKAAKEAPESTRYLNLDFEDFIPNLKPKFWYAGGLGYNAVVDKAVVHSGSASLRLEARSLPVPLDPPIPF